LLHQEKVDNITHRSCKISVKVPTSFPQGDKGQKRKEKRGTNRGNLNSLKIEEKEDESN